MDFFDRDLSQSSYTEFIEYVSQSLGMDAKQFRQDFVASCVSGDHLSRSYQLIENIFSFNCFTDPTFNAEKIKNEFLSKLFEFLVSGDYDFAQFCQKVKEFDYSERCSLVWTTNYFAYRCRTCGLSPTMSLCSACFTAGNHDGHDFNKFKSLAGGACDCGDSMVMKPDGFCCYHGPDNVSNRRDPPEELIAPLRCLLPRFLSAVLYFHMNSLSTSSTAVLAETVSPTLHVLHTLHACGWVALRSMADALLDESVFERFTQDAFLSTAYSDYALSLQTQPGISQLAEIDETLTHRSLLDAFVYMTVKLRFPENLVTFLIGVLAVQDFKQRFVESYVDHYTRIAATVIKSARSRVHSETPQQLNSRIIHISVQLFSAEQLTYNLVTDRKLHRIILLCIHDLCMFSRTRLDDKSNMVINCEGPLVHNNVFWPFVSDLGNLLSHRHIVAHIVRDAEFMRDWTIVLRFMQCMNCSILKEGIHTEFESVAHLNALSLEVETSSSLMWSLWQNLRLDDEAENCVLYAKHCVTALATFLSELGNLVSPSIQQKIQLTWPRSPFSLHLPLTRHAACFVQLSALVHNRELADLMSSLMTPNCYLLRRLMHEAVNIMLASQEVIVGYWVRNGHSLRRAIMYYMSSQYCHSFFELDIFTLQLCMSLLPPVYFVNAMLDQTRLMHEICLTSLTSSLVQPTSPTEFVADRKPLALEHWLLVWAFVLDNRTNMGPSSYDLLKKETISVLVPEARKRSDLANYIPERTAPTPNDDELSAVLKEVATYTGPTHDEHSGNLVSGHYALLPRLWHTEFDPIFHTIRSLTRSQVQIGMDKYTDHCRLRHGVNARTVLWPPYRIPPPLPSQFSHLEDVFNSRHFHYVIFMQLCLFVYGHALITEENLRLVIHFLNRAAEKIELSPTGSPVTASSASFDVNVGQTNLFPDSEYLPPWDQSIVTCPYSLGSNYADNLTCWLRIAPPPGGVQQCSTVVVTSTSPVSKGQALVGVIPQPDDRASQASDDPMNNQLSLAIVDSLLTLLIKAHSRLVLCRELDSTDSGVCYPVKPPQEDVPPPNPIMQALPFLAEAPIQQPPLKVALCWAVLGAASPADTSRPRHVDRSNNMADEAPQTQGGSTANIPASGLSPEALSSIAPELRYFAVNRPSYCMPDERQATDVTLTKQDKDCVGEDAALLSTMGDGAAYIESLLDKLVSRAPTPLGEHVRLYLHRACQPQTTTVVPLDGTAAAATDEVVEAMEVDETPSTNVDAGGPNSEVPKAPKSAISAEERKRRIKERQERMYADMMSQQDRVVAMQGSAIDEESSVEPDYDCVFCQQTADQPLVLFDIICESGAMVNMSECNRQPLLNGRIVNTSVLSHQQSDTDTHPDSNLLLSLECVGRRRGSMCGTRLMLAERAPDQTTTTDALQVQATSAAAHSVTPNLMAPAGTVGISTVAHSNPTAPTDLADVVDDHTHYAVNPVGPSSSSPAHITSAYYLESRMWWNRMLPEQLVKNQLAVTHNSVLIQTCGHAAHQKCLESYRYQQTQRSQMSRSRVWLSCPMCRRDVHHTMPITSVPLPLHSVAELPNPVRAKENLLAFLSQLANLPPLGRALWENVYTFDTSDRRQEILRDSASNYEAPTLLRAQLECELATLMSYPQLYSSVAKRCYLNEFICYLRDLYRRSDDFVCIFNCLTSSASENNDSRCSGEFLALCLDPVDILLTLVPFVWPNEETFLILTSGLYTLAYVRAVISLMVNRPYLAQLETTSTRILATQQLADQLPSPLREHIIQLIPVFVYSRLNPGSSKLRDTEVLSSAAHQFDAELFPSSDHLSLLSKPATFTDYSPEDAQLHVVLRLLPFLRLSTLLRAKWHVALEQAAGSNLPIDVDLLDPVHLPFVGQFADTWTEETVKQTSDEARAELIKKHLLEFTQLGQSLLLLPSDVVQLSDDVPPSITKLLAPIEMPAGNSGLPLLISADDKSPDDTSLVGQLIHVWLAQVSRADDPELVKRELDNQSLDSLDQVEQISFWAKHLPSLVECGRQLYPPRLIRPPDSFDRLFNALHVAHCEPESGPHQFQENLFCMICGQLMCAVCHPLDSAIIEHAKTCAGNTCIAFEVNTSMIYLALGSSICSWGSVYLDSFGEEDIELKRGKPLFLNRERWTLLEQQWLTHSFRQLGRVWRFL